MHAVSSKWRWFGSLVAAMTVFAAGCGGAGFVTSVDLPPEQRDKLPPTLSPGTVIKLPADRPFNVHDKAWNSTPGQDGRANPSADATPKGMATCKADGADGGSSWAEFQLGHCLDNHTGKPILAEVRMRIDYEHACQAAGGGAKTASLYTIQAFVKTTAGRVVQTLPLASHTSDDGKVNWSGAERTLIEVPMDPGMGYYIVLAGRAEAASQAKTSASAHIKVKSFVLEIVCKPPTATAPTAKGG